MDKNKANEKKRKFISWKYFVFIIIVIIGLVSFFVLREDNIKTTRIGYKEIISGFETRGLVIRDENIFKAPISGEVNMLLKEGERVAYGEKIAYIDNGDRTYNIYSREPGIISYAHDGLEQTLKYGEITPQVLQKYDEYERDYKQYISGNKIDKDKILYRIINNYDQYLLIKLGNDRAQKFNQNEIVFIDRENSKKNNSYIKAKIKKMYEHDEDSYLLLDLNYYVKEWNNTRWVNIKLIKNIYEGLAVPNSAIFKTTTGTKVLLYTFDGEIKTKDIKVVESSKNWSIVEDIEIGDKVITNPDNIDYGRNED
ncbi:MAG: HlyD family efflux transporter periplasmic adaptor subunit [Halanaerobiales bacterium]